MDFHLPQLGEGVYEAELVGWLIHAGDAVAPGQGLMEVLTDKATMEVPAPFAGTVTELRVQPGSTLKVGDLILTYTPTAAVAEEIAPPPPPAVALPHDHDPIRRERPRGRNGFRAEKPAAEPAATGSVKASPSVRLVARKLGIDLRQIHGTGPGGRVLINDLPAPTAAPTGDGAPHAPPHRSVAARLDYG
ncbi:MAG TPA: biotin/lipoyl-containing protein, partial [Gemmataceae bacterium]|nr:biotin/lipoyl-containing protein [Gemmataceae bacterium]